MTADDAQHHQGTNAEGEVVRWYTRARRFPQLIGRTPDGTKIWGGPYTVTQVVGAGLVLVVGLKTSWLWARSDLLTNAFILIAVTVGTLFALGRIPVGSRNPVSVAAGAFRAFAAPRTGRLAGQPIRIRRPRRPRRPAPVLIAHDRLPGTQPQSEATPAPTAEPVAAPVPPRQPLTGIQSLLAAAGQSAATKES